MAKTKQTGTDVAVVERGGAVAVPDYLKGFKGPTGAEAIASEDVTVPRIKIGQDMSPEVQEGSLERGDLFLNVSGEALAAAGEKLPFVVLALGKEYILWRPKLDGGGILARAKPVKTPDGVRYQWDKPNQTFEVKVGGVLPVKWKTKEFIDEDGLGEWGSEIPGNKESKKAATDHFNYVVALPTLGNQVAAFSLSKTQSGRAKDLNAMLKMGSAPLTARVYTAETVDDSRDEHKFKNFKFRAAGFVQNPDDFAFYSSQAEAFKSKTVNVDQSDGGGDEVERDERA